MSNPTNGRHGPSPATTEQLREEITRLKAPRLRWILLEIVDRLIQIQTALQLLVDLVERGATK